MNSPGEAKEECASQEVALVSRRVPAKRKIQEKRDDQCEGGIDLRLCRVVPVRWRHGQKTAAQQTGHPSVRSPPAKPHVQIGNAPDQQQERA